MAFSFAVGMNRRLGSAFVDLLTRGSVEFDESLDYNSFFSRIRNDPMRSARVVRF